MQLRIITEKGQYEERLSNTDALIEMSLRVKRSNLTENEIASEFRNSETRPFPKGLSSPRDGAGSQ